MKRISSVLAMLVVLAACGSVPPPRLVYSSGFSFANYDYLVIRKPGGSDTSTSLYGMDIEFANLMSRYNMNVIGDKEYDTLSSDNKKRTLYARMSLIANGKFSLASVSFDDAVTGRTGSSISAHAKGNIFNNEDRTLVLEALSKTIVNALQQDKGIKVIDRPVNAEREVLPARH